MLSVFKFGGASLKDSDAIKNVKSIISHYGGQNQLLVVVSAIGKTTNALVDIVEKYHLKEDYNTPILELKKHHFEILKELFPSKEHTIYTVVEKAFIDLRAQFNEFTNNKNKLYDQVVSYGELISSLIVSAYLNLERHTTEWIDARKYVQTNESWQEAKVDWAWSEMLMHAELPSILKHKIILTQGFLGGTVGRKTTTLGREGSDFSASIFASCLNAASVTIWKDVPGILNADPKRMKEVQLFSKLSYKDTAEMTYYGATVIHPKTIRPLALKKIPLYVKSFKAPEDDGTCIGDFEEVSLIPSYIFKPNQSLIRFEENDFANVDQSNLARVFNLLSILNIRVNLMRTSAISFSICSDTNYDKFDKLRENLESEFSISMYHDLELVTIKNHTPESIRNFEITNTIYWMERTRNIYQVLRKKQN